MDMVINYDRLDLSLDCMDALDEIDLEYGLPEPFWLSYQWKRIMKLRKMVCKEMQVTREELGIRYDETIEELR